MASKYTKEKLSEGRKRQVSDNSFRRQYPTFNNGWDN